MAPVTVDNVKEALFRKYCIKIPSREWLEQCVEFAVDAEEGDSLSVEEVVAEVLCQLLEFDLVEMAEPSLPPHIENCTKAVIKGHYLCQVQRVADVSRPFYRQYQEMTKTYNRDCEIGAYSEEHNGELNPTYTQMNSSQRRSAANSQIAYPNRESGKRTLAMQLTDGKITVKGLEYVPIPSLDPRQMLPGCKVVIMNRVVCRRGILFLRPENIRVLGGRVASLIPHNLPLHLFASTLGKEDHLRTLLESQQSNSSNANDLHNRSAPMIMTVQDYNRASQNHQFQQFQASSPQWQTVLPNNPISSGTVTYEVGTPINAGPSNPTESVIWQSIPEGNSVQSLPTSTSRQAQNRPRATAISNTRSQDSTPSIRGDQITNASVNQVTPSGVAIPPQSSEGSERNYEIVTLPSSPNEQDRFHFGLNNVNLIENDGLDFSPVVSDNVVDNEEAAEVLSDSLSDPNNSETEDSGLCVAIDNDLLSSANVSQNQSNLPVTPGRPLSSNQAEGLSETAGNSTRRDEMQPKFTSTPNVKSTSRVSTAPGTSGSDHRQTNETENSAHNAVSVAITRPFGMDATSKRMDLGECLLADLKTCQYGPPGIQMSYTAQVKCRVDTVLCELSNEGGQMWNLRVRLIDSSATLDVQIASQVLEEIIGLSPLQVMECQPFILEGSQEAKQITQSIEKVPEFLKQPRLEARIVYEHTRLSPSANEKKWPIVTRLRSC